MLQVADTLVVNSSQFYKKIMCITITNMILKGPIKPRVYFLRMIDLYALIHKKH